MKGNVIKGGKIEDLAATPLKGMMSSLSQ